MTDPNPDRDRTDWIPLKERPSLEIPPFELPLNPDPYDGTRGSQGRLKGYFLHSTLWPR